MRMIRPWAASLHRNQRGVAFIEFAYALPFMLVTLLGGVELVHLALTHQQLSRLATSTADLASRYRSSIDEAHVNTLLLGSRLSLRLDDFDTNGRIILSSVTKNNADLDADGDEDDIGHWIRWQRCDGNLTVDSELGEEGDGETDNSIVDVNGMVITDPNNVMIAEVSYAYSPWFFPGENQLLARIAPLFVPRTITYSSAFIARELTLNAITNSNSLSDAERALCTA